MRTANRSRRSITARSAFAGFRFPPDVIVLAVRWYLCFGLSYRPASGGRVRRTSLGDLIPAEVGLQPARGRRNPTAPSNSTAGPSLQFTPAGAEGSCVSGGGKWEGTPTLQALVTGYPTAAFSQLRDSVAGTGFEPV